MDGVDWQSLPLEIAGGNVERHRRAAAEVTAGQRSLEHRLTRQQPVQGRVQLGLLHRAQAKNLAQRRDRRPENAIEVDWKSVSMCTPGRQQSPNAISSQK